MAGKAREGNRSGDGFTVMEGRITSEEEQRC